jgi:molybdate transport system substrate-binding protein
MEIGRSKMLVALATGLAISIAAGPAGAADIRVFSGGAPQSVLRGLAPEFEKATGHRVEFTFALVTAIQQKLAAGEKADLILLALPLISETEKTLPLRTEGRVVLARVGIGVITRQGATRPDISTADAVRKMLLQARSVAFGEPSTPSGGHVAQVMVQLGIADAIRPKRIIKAAISGGGELVANGEADVGLYLVSEVQTIKGITVVGLLPSALQSFVVYGTAVPAYNATPQAALAFVRFLSDPANGERWKAGGFELLGSGN